MPSPLIAAVNAVAQVAHARRWHGGRTRATFHQRSREHTGLESPPTVTRDASGRQFMLRANDIGSLDVGSPI